MSERFSIWRGEKRKKREQRGVIDYVGRRNSSSGKGVQVAFHLPF